MQLTYVPLLREMLRLYSLPRSMDRFRDYLRTMSTHDGEDLEFPPLVMINPMAREHLRDYLDALMQIDAERIAQNAVAAVVPRVSHVAGDFSASLVVLVDLRGGWTNRFAAEYGLYKLAAPRELPPRQARRCWVTGVLWSSEPPTPESVRQAMAGAVFRRALVQQHGGAQTLAELLRQEGWVLNAAGCKLDQLDAQARSWTATVCTEFGAATDRATHIAVLFGDSAAESLGYETLGLAARAGLRLAAEEARQQDGGDEQATASSA
jgi:hypothetical protein